jgi:hypothetical protein
MNNMEFESRVNAPVEVWGDENIDISQIYLKKFGKFAGFKIYEVYGDYIMLHFDMDFVIAGNGYAKNYIPRDEIWLDRMVSTNDVLFVIVHEITEAIIMRDLGYTYEKAHRIANEIEYQARKRDYTFAEAEVAINTT